MTLLDAAIAANRFGLGARPGELPQIAGDARGWLVGQLEGDDRPAELDGMESSDSLVVAQRRAREAGRGKDGRDPFEERIREVYRREMAARELVAARTDRPFRERLVRFWSNHFCVSTTRQPVVGLAGSFEREAIRPNLGGSFEALLLAAERHPAMQLYLDNARSVGPDSPAGQRSGRGLNENHAREILELHTLGVGGGYGQADVEALAAILTGWGLARGRGEVDGRFTFDPLRHQPGSKVLLGKRIAEGGEAEGKQALGRLAHHPSTARFVAGKLVRHFVSDHPPADALDAVARVFEQSGGDLPAVHRALVELPAAWQRAQGKLKSPAELVVSAARSLGYEADGEPMLRSVRYLGQMPFAAPSPQGWSDAAGDWLGPEAVLLRVEWAEKVGRDGGWRAEDPVALADGVLGPLLGERTRQALLDAKDRAQAVALLIASPEFQRR